ncbi:MAG: amidohydrolase family protein, partial [Candidatus Bathyarchaeia archaeon]
MFDIIIKDGLVVSGAGNPWFRADVGVKDSRIVSLGRISKGEAERVIDAGGLVVCPGFIDMHSHSDFTLLVNPRAESKIRQGVTTEVIGNCGHSAAPMNEATKNHQRKTNPLIEEAGIDLDWSTMGEYLDRLRGQGVALNVATLVGHGAVRAYVMGYEKRPPRRGEMEEMRAVVEGAMEDGAFGMSTGLIYPPSSYAATEELVELCRVVARYGGIYTSHIRGEAETLLEAVEEAVFIGAKAGLPVEINHHKAMGRANWGKVEESLSIIEGARERGVDVTCDAYPYIAASFGLRAMLPPWAHEGGVDRMVERLKDPKARGRMERDMARG